MENFITGLVTVQRVKDGKILSETNNSFLLKGEEFLAKFLSRRFSDKYDANEGASQAGYFDFVAVGSGFKAPINGTDRVVVLPNKIIGVPDEAVDVFDNKTIKFLSGDNSGINGVVAVNGYNPANPDFENKPTLTLENPLDNTIEAGTQFVVAPSVMENALQGENRSDYKGASFLNPTSSRVQVTSKKTLSNLSTPAGGENEVYIESTIGNVQFSGGASLLLCEALLVNTLTPATDPAVKSGEALARVLLTPTEIGEGEAVNIFWRLRIGAPRALSI
jgi:hypothetical protein